MVLKKAWIAITALVALGALSACATSTTGTSGTSSTTGSGGSGGSDTTGTGGTGGKPDVPVCGDGTVANTESCDDGNKDDGDGCSATCEFEPGWTCEGEPTACKAVCGDGKVVGKEECDDSNVSNGDGCTNACTVALGWACEGAPSVCTTPCGDGIIAGQEQCDDSNSAVGDGCSETCQVEPGFTCVMVPSKCASICGDGIIASNEVCDDKNFMPGDGCTDTCTVEEHWTCDGAPSICVTPCGDGLIVGLEACDDGNLNTGDGCGVLCATESGYACMGEPSVCATVCGDSVVAGAEVCDDGNATSGDGCNVFCNKEPGWVCNNGMPTVCNTICGDGYPAGAETCDDGNLVKGDGCDTSCLAEHGYVCFNIPSVCSTVCGDGQTGGLEQCDDGNANSGDGCSATCTSEVGFTCAGEPSVCTGICGDAIVIGTETCDDGNLLDGDCCSSTCGAELGCEIEINDEVATANDYSAIAIGNIIKGFVKPGTDSDFYRYSIVVPAGSTGAITATTLDGFAAASCANNTLASQITIYDANSNPLATDKDSGPGLCSIATAGGLQTGDYYVEVKSGKAAGQTPFDYTFQITTQLVVCGDGVKGPGEECDDGNLLNDDGCSDLCVIEVSTEIEPNDTPAQATANGNFPTNELWAGAINPSVDPDYYQITLPVTVDLRIETFDGLGPNNCTATDTVIALFGANGVTQLATDDDDGLNACSLLNPATDAGMRHLLPGTYFVRIRSFSQVIPAYRVLLTFTAVCGNNIKEGFEECDGAAGPACDANCNIIPVCGDGIVKVPETCDDGNLMDGDGCSSICAPEPNYICVGQPSLCTLHENVCNDGMDNDADMLVDCFDPDCQGQAICVILPCNAGQTQRIYSATDTPKAIADNTTITSTIAVPDVTTINRVIVKLNITHTWAADLDIFIASPMAPNVELSTDNGGSSDNFTNTVFDQNCLNSIVMGAAPFNGCFKPEGMLPVFNGQMSNGNWVLSVGDDAGGDQGSLLSWDLILCTTP